MPERRAQAVEEFRQHALPAHADLPQGRQVVIVPSRAVEQGEEQRRRHRQNGRPVSLDGTEQLVGIGGGGEGHAAADGQRGDHSRCAQREVVRGRQADHVHGVGPPSQRTGALAGVVRVVGMRARNELGDAGGAARQQHERHVEGIGAMRAQRRFAIHRLGRTLQPRPDVADARVGAVPGGDQVLQCRCAGLHLFRHGHVVEAAEAGRNKVRRRTGHRREMPDLRAPVSGQAQDGNDADLVEREEDEHELPDVRQLNQDDVARSQAAPDQLDGEPVGETVDLLVRQPAITVRQEDAVRMRARSLLDRLRERSGLPPAVADIASGKLRRPWRTPFEHRLLPGEIVRAAAGLRSAARG